MSKKTINILEPILQDKVLMALMRFKYVPLAFILQKCNLSFNQKNAIDVIKAFDSLDDGQKTAGSDFSINFLGIKPQFQVIKKAIHLSTGIEGSVKATSVLVGAEVIDMLTKKVISINTIARDISSDFNNKVYKPFLQQVTVYERVLRDADRQTSLALVLEKHSMTNEDWRKLKANIARFGLNRDIHLASEVLIEGSLIHALQRQYIGRSVSDVVSELLRSSLKI